MYLKIRKNLPAEILVTPWHSVWVGDGHVWWSRSEECLHKCSMRGLTNEDWGLWRCCRYCRVFSALGMSSVKRQFDSLSQSLFNETAGGNWSKTNFLKRLWTRLLQGREHRRFCVVGFKGVLVSVYDVSSIFIPNCGELDLLLGCFLHDPHKNREALKLQC